MIKSNKKFKLAANIFFATGLIGSIATALVSTVVGLNTSYKKDDMFKNNENYSQFIEEKEEALAEEFNGGVINKDEYEKEMATLKGDSAYTLYISENGTAEERQQFNALQKQILNSSLVAITSATISTGLAATQTGIIVNKDRQKVKEINRQNAKFEEKE